MAESTQSATRKVAAPEHEPSVGKRQRQRLSKWHQLSEWQRDNEYILDGYRQASYSYAASLSSVFEAHNETINIWSHLIGALIFTGALIQFWRSWQNANPLASFEDMCVVSVYYSAVITCFVLSTTFHVFLNHSPGMHKFGNQLDHLGIVVVMWGSSIPADYFGFYGEPVFIWGYWIMSTIAAVGCAIFTLQPRFRTRAYRSQRVMTYFLLGASAFIPFVHAVYLNGWREQNLKMSISYFIGLALLNGSGAVIYGIRIPEKWFPGKFDMFGASHQLMHVLVICGALSHLTGVLRALEHRQQLRIP